MTRGYLAKDIGEKRECVYCKKVFYRFKKARCGRRTASLRKSDAITCSSSCSKLLVKLKEKTRYY